jgi:hypothetical protein
MGERALRSEAIVSGLSGEGAMVGEERREETAARVQLSNLSGMYSRVMGVCVGEGNRAACSHLFWLLGVAGEELRWLMRRLGRDATSQTNRWRGNRDHARAFLHHRS